MLRDRNSLGNHACEIFQPGKNITTRIFEDVPESMNMYLSMSVFKRRSSRKIKQRSPGMATASFLLSSVSALQKISLFSYLFDLVCPPSRLFKTCFDLKVSIIACSYAWGHLFGTDGHVSASVTGLSSKMADSSDSVSVVVYDNMYLEGTERVEHCVMYFWTFKKTQQQ